MTENVTNMTEELVDVDGNIGLARRIYDSVLVPAFPPDELEDWETFLSALQGDGGTSAIALAFISGDEPTAAIVGYRYTEAQVLLIGYIAVKPNLRGAERGTRLLTAARERWSSQDWNALIVAEVEDPRQHSVSAGLSGRDAERGDPVRRLAFYQRNGGMTVDRPYFQPQLRPDSSRVYGMLLIVLPPSPWILHGSQVRSRPLVRFLQEYFAECEGPTVAETDEKVRNLIAGYASGEYLDLIPLDHYLLP